MGVKLQSSSGGSVDITAPVTASNYVLTAPAASGTILNDASSLAAAMLTGNVDVARLVSAFSGSNVSLAGSGYQKLPSGLIIQWGYVGFNAGNYTQTFNFPLSFPTTGFSIVITGQNTGGSENAENFMAANFSSVSQFNAHNYYNNSGIGAYWIAIGY